MSANATKEQRAEYNRRYYANGGKEKIMASNASRRRKMREDINQIKDAPCTDCGVTYPPEVMEFDHVTDEKNAGISSMVSSMRPWDVILNEIALCELVCANCHRLRTSKRRDMGHEQDGTASGS